MKNIVFLVKNVFNQGGDTRAVTLLANKLIELENYKITILSLFKTGELPTFYINEAINICNLFGNPFSLRKNYFKVVQSFKKFIENNKIDIIIIEAIGFNCFTFPVLRNYKAIKTISVEHASFFDGGKMLGLAWFGRKIACKHNDCVVVLTKRDKSDYKRNIQKINRIEQIYNPMDSKLIKSNYNYASKKIITCGRLVHVKGYDLLLDVARKVFDIHPDWRWHIYGNGEEREKIKEKISLLNLENNVLLMGEVKNIYEKYKDYAFYVMTSRSESFGMVLLEALKSGIPVVSFDCRNGPGEIIIDNINGFLIPPFNVNVMAKKICELIGNRNLRIEFASNSEKKLEDFEANTIAKKWISLINSI